MSKVRRRSADYRVYGSASQCLRIARWCGGKARTSGRIIVPTPAGDENAWIGDTIHREAGGTFWVEPHQRLCDFCGKTITWNRDTKHWVDGDPKRDHNKCGGDPINYPARRHIPRREV